MPVHRRLACCNLNWILLRVVQTTQLDGSHRTTSQFFCAGCHEQASYPYTLLRAGYANLLTDGACSGILNLPMPRDSYGAPSGGITINRMTSTFTIQVTAVLL